MGYVAVNGWFDDLQQAGSQILQAGQQAGGQAMQAGQQVVSQVKEKISPTAGPGQKSWDEAANELKAAVEMARRQAMVDGLSAAFEIYAAKVTQFLAGDLAVMSMAASAGDQLASVKPTMQPRTDDIKARMLDMAKAAVEGKMNPPPSGSYSLSQLSNQISQVQSKLGVNPMYLAAGAGLLGLGVIWMLSRRKSK